MSASFSWPSYDRRHVGLRAKGLELLQLLHAPAEFLVGAETRCQKSAQDLFRKLDADNPGAHTKQVDIVVFDGLMRAERVVAERSPDALDLVARNRGPHSGAAHHDPPLSPAGEYFPADLPGDVRKIDRSCRIAAYVVDRVPP